MASRALGTLTLDLLVKMGGFVQGLDKAHRITEQQTRAMRKSLQNIERGFSSLKNAVLGFAGALGVGFTFKAIIDQTVNFQREQAQLEAVLKSTGRAAYWSTDQLNKMARQMSAVGGGSLFNEGEINQAQARLLAYQGVVGEQFPRAMQAAIDMATRMGTDVSSAAETMGRALDIPSQGLTALTRQGFRFTDAQKELVTRLEETGRTAEAQGIILDAVESSYAGAAEASRNTLGGALEALKGSFNNLMTGDGGSVAGFKNSIENLVKTLNSPETAAGFQAFITGLSTLANWAVEALNKVVQFTNYIANAIAGPGSQGMESYYNDQIKELEFHKRYLEGMYEGAWTNYQREVAVKGLSETEEKLREAIRLRDEWAQTGKWSAPEVIAPIAEPPKIGAVGGGRSRADASQREVQKALQEQARMIEQYNDQLNDVRLSWMEINGQAVEVAGIKFDQQYDGLRAFLTLSQDWGSLGMLDQLKQMQVAAVQFDQAMKPISQTFQNLQYSEQMLNVSKQLGGVSEIGSLIQLAELRRGAFEEVTAQLEELQEVMNSGNATPEMVEQMKQLQLQAAQLEAGLNPLGVKFADVFSKSMESPLFDFISGTKSAGEAFRDFANSVISDMARMAVQQSLTNLFSNSGLGGFFGGMFGGGKLIKNAKGNVIAGGGISALRNSIVTSTTLFPIPPGGVLPFANGGVVGATGEAGPEAIMPLTRSSNGALGVRAVGGGGGGDISVTITNIFQDGGTTSKTTSDKSDQNAQALAKAIDQAVKNSLARELMQGGIIWNIKNGR